MIRVITALALVSCAAASYAGRSVTIDPVFPYYKDRSKESIVDEIKANGYDDVRMACVSESGINAELVKAFSGAGVKVWMLTFANGAYSTADLPKGWESWKMKLRGRGNPDGFIYLCPNNPAFREWKKKQLTAALKAHPFHGVDLAEAFFPAYLGPKSELYGCMCEFCTAAFRKMHPEVTAPPDFEDPASPGYYTTDKVLYEKWVGFRVASVVSHLDDIVNGKGGVREKCPGVKVATWSLGLDVPDQLQKLREWEAIDAAAIVRRVKPDLHVIQTDWPDWIRTNLPASYPLKYKPVSDSIREVSPDTPLMLQADIGSKDNMRRGREWISEVEESAKRIRCQSTTHYEYHLGDYIYTEPPAVMSAEFGDGVIKLVFNKRLDPVPAANISNYALSSGRIDFARVDGSVVRLSVSGTDNVVTIGVSGLSDDESRRFFHDRPACEMAEPVRVQVEQQR